MFDTAKIYIIAILLALAVGMGIRITALTSTNNEQAKQIGILNANAKDDADTITFIRKVSADKNAVIETFSKSFEELGQKEEQRQKDVQAALLAIQDQVLKNTDTSKRILSAVPKSADLCKEANDLINSYLIETQVAK